MAVDMELMKSIRRVELDIDESKERIATLKEARQVSLDNMQEYADVTELEGKLKEARETLKWALTDDKDIAPIDADLEEERFKLKDLRDILSVHLLKYRDDTGQNFVEEEGSKKIRPLIITAKKGKLEFHQEEMFGELAPGDGKWPARNRYQGAKS